MAARFFKKRFPTSTRYGAMADTDNLMDTEAARPAAWVDVLDAHTREHGPKQWDRAKPGEQLQLFEHNPETIVGAFAHPSMSFAMPSLLGLAVNQVGRIPMPDASLSADSSTMVKNLRQRGVGVPVNEQNPDAAANNELAEKDKSMWTLTVGGLINGGDATLLDKGQVREGSQTARKMLRKRGEQQFGGQ